MDIFPAIDLMNGQAVRLRQGDYAEKTVYDADPLRRARAFYNAGARYLHAVDLDGARSGRTDNFETVRALAAESGLRVEIGGGIRSLETAERYREAGVWRVILGTAAAEDPELLRRCVESFGAGVAVGVDVRDGMVMTRGWLEGGTLSCESFCGRLAELGVDTVICTDISRDGMLAGVNAALYAELIARFPTLRFVASGGVSRLEDVVRLREMGLSGAIIGKALYTGAVDLREAVLAGEGETA